MYMRGIIDRRAVGDLWWEYYDNKFKKSSKINKS